MNRGPSIAFIDVFALMLVVLFILPMRPEVAANDDQRAGLLVVEAHWPDGYETDVDLWVQSPGDRPVGYSRLRGVFFSLYRDDLGNTPQTPWRYEIASTRLIPDGEYIINLHLFTDNGHNVPVIVAVRAWARHGKIKTMLWQGDVILSYAGQEITAARWAMRDGQYLPGSLHYSPITLRQHWGTP